MDEVVFRLDISENEYLRFYRGLAQNVVVTAYDGRRIQFPAANLRRFVTRTGVRGEFSLKFAAHRKLVDLRRIGP